jgi:hypothetical protein
MSFRPPFLSHSSVRGRGSGVREEKSVPFPTQTALAGAHPVKPAADAIEIFKPSPKTKFFFVEIWNLAAFAGVFWRPTSRARDLSLPLTCPWFVLDLWLGYSQPVCPARSSEGSPMRSVDIYYRFDMWLDRPTIFNARIDLIDAGNSFVHSKLQNWSRKWIENRIWNFKKSVLHRKSKQSRFIHPFNLRDSLPSWCFRSEISIHSTEFQESAHFDFGESLFLSELLELIQKCVLLIDDKLESGFPRQPKLFAQTGLTLILH